MDNTLTVKNSDISWTGFYSFPYRKLSEHLEGNDIEFNRVLEYMQRNPAEEYHAEFVGIALFSLSQNSNFKIAQLTTKQLNHLLALYKVKYTSVNWLLMGYISKQFLLNKVVDVNHILTIIKQDDAGMLIDIPGIISTQYHSYILLLLLLVDDKNQQLRIIIKSAFEWLIKTFDVYGNVNSLGRGKFQKFGYTSIIAASKLFEQKYLTEVPSKLIDNAIHCLENFEDIMSAVSPKFSYPGENSILHQYNTLDDYNAFTNFWLKYVNINIDSQITKKQKILTTYIQTSNDTIYMHNGTDLMFVLSHSNNTSKSLKELVKERLFGHKKASHNKVYHLTDRSLTLSIDTVILKNIESKISFFINSASYLEIELYINSTYLTEKVINLTGSTTYLHSGYFGNLAKWKKIDARLVRASSLEVEMEIEEKS